MSVDEVSGQSGENPATPHPDALLSLSLHPRLAWMMCYEQTRSVSEVCRKFGISRKTFYKWFQRYMSSKGDSGSLKDHSRRPNNFPRATPESTVKLIKQAKDETGFGQRKLKAYLAEKYQLSISERTIWKLLKRIEETATGHTEGGSHSSYIQTAGAAH